MGRPQLITTFAAALTLALLSGAFATAVGENAPPFDLKDQFGKQWKLADLKDQVTVIVAANPKSGKAMGPWVDNLKLKYAGKIHLLGLMDLHTVPWIGRGIAKSRIKKETSDPLMLDFNGDTSKNYLVSDKYPVVVVIDKNGVVRALRQTDYSREVFEATIEVIDKAL